MSAVLLPCLLYTSGQVIQEAVDAYTEQTGVKVDLQFKGRTGNREALQPALDGGTQIDIFDEDIDRGPASLAGGPPGGGRGFGCGRPIRAGGPARRWPH